MTTNQTTEDLINDQVRRGKRIQDLQSRFPKSPPTRSDYETSMYNKLVDIDRLWVDFIQCHDHLVLEGVLDPTSEYVTSSYKDKIREVVASVMELASSHVLAISGIDPKYDLINRPTAFKYVTMLNEDGTVKDGARPPVDPSIIESRLSIGGNRNTSNPRENPFDSDSRSVSVNDILNLSGNGSRNSGHANLLSSIQGIEQVMTEMEQLNDDDPKLFSKGNLLTNRMKATYGIHEKLLVNNDNYNPSLFRALEDRVQAMMERLDVAEFQRGPTTATGPPPQQHIKMPTINMPTFDGDYTKWRWFKDLFLEMVNRRQISNVEKFVYLRQNLTGECAKLIGHLPLTNDNYALAWATLEKRYENPRQIMKATINKLFNLEKARSECPQIIKKIHDIFHENMHAILQMGGSSQEVLGMVFHQLLLNKLDAGTYTLYEQSLDDSTIPQSADNLLAFLVKRFQALEQSGAGKVNPPSQPKIQFPKWKRTTALVASTNQNNAGSSKPTSNKICVCKQRHPVSKCPKFLEMNAKDRFNKVREAGRCVNCFASNHSSKDCKSTKCRVCSKPHHTLLHFGPQATSLLSAAKRNQIQHVFLGTVCLQIQNSDGVFIKARALLDSGSQVNIMTEHLLKNLGLKTQTSNLEVLGMGQVAAKATKRTVVNIASSQSNFKTSLEVYVMKNITSVQPSSRVDIDKWNVPTDLPLADEKFNIPATIDIIIGGELFYQLLATGFQQLGDQLPDLQNTVFGWIVVGRMVGLEPTKAFSGMGLAQDTSLKETLSKFWEIEERGTEEKPLSDKELACEQYFADTTVQGADGRFTVKLQFNSSPDDEIGKSLETATRRFLALERKLARDPEMRKQYDEFMDEYEKLGHMEKLTDFPRGIGCYYIPHHAVLNPSSSTTKFRVVFDASAKTSTNTSLNELMENGPTLQDDLFTIMARFRMMQYVFSADITKMYRQIQIAKEDQRWQLIVWRKAPSLPLNCYRLKTVTYGTKCASYLAIKTLQFLADMKADQYPLAAMIAKRDFNVDDIMSGSNNLQEALIMQDQLIRMLKGAGMELHKWCANHPQLLENIPAGKKEISLDFQAGKEETKALGMKWIPKVDEFSLKYQPRHHQKITKRTVLSEIAQLFDPLGLVGPVIVRAKVFIQELWDLEYDWDIELPPELQSKWMNYRKELLALTGICVPRHVVINNAFLRELHIFSDASEIAYGATVYVRSLGENGTHVSFLCAKSRVAPVEKMSLPRLELCGAKLAVELGAKLRNKLGNPIDRVIFWTDSEIVLSWINTQASLKTFVANRVSKIRRASQPSDWRYVETKHNPADIISRGCSTADLKRNSLWWNGPSFLIQAEGNWPSTKPAFQRLLEEEKKPKSILIATAADQNIIGKINHGNSIVAWQRIVAYCLKFGNKRQPGPEDTPRLGNLTTMELKRAMQAIVKYAQHGAFHDDILWLKKGQPEKTQFRTMTPIFDADGVLRVGGRLQAANMSFEEKHPIILPYKHEVTQLILTRIHLDNRHAGPQALLAIARQRYWIVKGKLMAKNIVDTCVLCCRAKPKLLEQVMGPLPKDRVTVARPFQTTGVDFAGPVYIHQSRGKAILKSYICVFVCFVTKAVHLEAATDLSTPAFLRCLKRFIARRGIPKRIYSDNGTNFLGMHNQLLDLADQMNSEEFKEKVSRYCENLQIEWRFTPPRSPHFGGLWEAAVKSAKHLLTRTLHNFHVTYDELITVLAEIEAILNSRPILPLTDDPNDLQPLTAGHFLIGAPMNSINDEFIPDVTPLQNWAKLVAIRNEFWNRWHKEYLQELQSKGKWRNGSPNITVGKMVILKDQNLPPLKWRMGRIESVIPDKDGVVRVVRIHTSNGLFTRAIHELAPLPVESTLERNDVETNIRESRLNVNAQEFKMHSNQKILKTDTKFKQSKKPQNKKVKKVHFEPLTTKTTERRTRSGRIFGPSNMSKTMILLTLAFGLLFMGAIATPCNTTQFLSNPGLYYESLGKLSLSNDEWKLVCHMDLQQYRKEPKIILDILDHMKAACPEVHPGEHCDIIINQMRDQVQGLNTRNELIAGFAEKTRMKRDTSNFFYPQDDRKNGGRLSQASSITPELFGEIRELELEELEETQQQVQMKSIIFELLGKIETAELDGIGEQIRKQQASKRVKRGWFDGIGKGAREVFGILDVDDAKHYEDQISALKENEGYLKELIQNQTTIQEITSNIMRRDQKKLNKVMELLAENTRTLGDKDLVGKTHVFNTLSIQALHAIQRYQEIQATIINMLTLVFHGKIPPVVISPTQLRKQLAIVASHIDHSLMIPGSDQHNYISQLYKMLSAKVHVTDYNLIVEIKIPLISREHYQLYHIVPVPFEQNQKLKMVSPSATYIGINPKQDHYYLMKTEEKQNCLVYNDGLIICRQQQPLHNVQTNQTRCEMAIIIEPKQIHRACKIIDFNYAQSWTALAQRNSHMYAMRQKTDINIICGTQTQHCSLTGTGIMNLDENCIVKSGTLEISSKNQMDGEDEIVLLIPLANITDHLPEEPIAQPPSAIANWNSLSDSSAEWEVLTRALEQQKANANYVFPNRHDIHHYSVTYTLIISLIIFGVAFWYRETLQKLFCRKPAQRNRRFVVVNNQPSAIVPENNELQEVRLSVDQTEEESGRTLLTSSRFHVPKIPPRNVM